MTAPIVVTARITCPADSAVPQVVETLCRACAGLAMEGLFTAVFVQREEPDAAEPGCR